MPDDRQAGTSALVSLFRHNTWANLKLLDACALLTEDQLSATVIGTYGSIRDTLLHFVYAEVDYVTRVTGQPPGVATPSDVLPTLDMLGEAVRWSGDELLVIADAARVGQIVREEDKQQGFGVEYPLSEFIVQILNHSTEHRTQISAIITGLGIEPPDMSGWAYMESIGEFREFHLNG